jgi:hypothetical protein
MPSTTNIHSVPWGSILKANLNCLFQAALLLSADPEVAEASVAATIESIDLSRVPGQDELVTLQMTLVSKTLERLESSSPDHLRAAQSMLPTGLWTLLEVDQFPRIYFVLRVLLRCAVSSSAQILGVEEADAQAMFETALWQLCNATQEPRCQKGSKSHSRVQTP